VARRTLISLLLPVALLIGGIGSSAGATLPSLYVSYNMSCHFTMSLDSGAAVNAGSSIPYGQYQVVVSTPIAFSNGQGSCDFINFQLSGPGVSYTTQLAQGDATQDIQTETFQAGGSYTASDSTVPPGTSIGFSASSTPVTAPGGSSSSSGGKTSSSGSGGLSALGTPLPPARILGTLSGSVSSAGKLTLTLKGKGVATLKAGTYTVTVNDESRTAGFMLQTSGAKTTVTSPAFVGSKSVTVDLTKGQWDFYGKAGATRGYFVATG